jgi:hypothetical protein
MVIEGVISPELQKPQTIWIDKYVAGTVTTQVK